MGWREELRLATLTDETEIEVRCCKCGKHRYEFARALRTQGRLGQAFMDQVERALICRDRHCTGKQRIALTHDHLMEGFVGGMP